MWLTTIVNALLTVLSTSRVSQLLIWRGVMSVPTALIHTVSTSTPPATAATARPANGTTMRAPRAANSYAEPTETRRCGRTVPAGLTGYGTRRTGFRRG